MKTKENYIYFKDYLVEENERKNNIFSSYLDTYKK